MSIAAQPPLISQRTAAQAPTRSTPARPPRDRGERGDRITLGISARELSRCRFFVSPLLEVLAAAELLCGQYPAALGRRPRGPKFGKRHAFTHSAVQRHMRLAAGRLALRERGGAARQETDFAALGPMEGPVREFFQECLAEDWPRIRTALESDVALRAHDLAAYGVRQVVDSLPGVTVREVRGEPAGGERELILVPSVFQRTRVLLTGAGGSVITYPASGHRRIWDDEAVAPTRLGALLGRGRAAALLNIGAGCGTTELADRLGVSAGTASVHVSALRNGGLVATHRIGKAVKHVLTPVGSALLTAHVTAETSMLPQLF